MLPTKLRLRNFMCYASDTPTLDFRGVHLACLAGDNGHGKSALLDAITWALWGKSRARSDNELIRQGESEMEVELEFLLGADTYRVLRKRTNKGAGKSLLELQIKANDEFRPLTEPTLRDTEDRIEALLRMNYETFINSAYLQQGKADAFTLKSPGERKALLAQILGLSQYDEFEARAKARVKEADHQIDLLRATLADIEREVARLPEHQLAERNAQAAVAELSLKLRAAENAQRATETQRQELLAAQRELDDLERRLAHVQRDIADAQREREARNKQLDQCLQLIEQKAEIEAGFSALQLARASETEWHTRALQHANWNAEISRLTAKIDAARNELATKLATAQARLADAQTRQTRAGNANALLKQAADELARLVILDAERATADAAIRNALEMRSALVESNRTLKEKMLDIKTRLDDLAQADAACPLCHQPLSQHDHARLLDEFRTSGVALGDEHRANSARAAELDAQIHAQQARLAEIDAALQQRARWERQHAQAEQLAAEAQAALATATQAQNEIDDWQKQLTERAFAQDTQDALEKAMVAQKLLAYDEIEHRSASRKAAELTPWDEQHRNLQRALTESEAIRTQVQQLDERLARWLEASTKDRARADELRQAVAQLTEIAALLATQLDAVKTLEKQLDRAHQELGAARQQIEACNARLAQQAERKAALDLALEERTLYDELQLAFGKKGVQAMIIEAAIPEIEEEANRLLARMTNQRMSVQFLSQRDTKKGDTVETLDIVIKDDLGPRAYELFSGGEAFRANFAIRIALSKLLARRAGARLQTLIVDEGFGSQDAIGRERLVEAITSIQNDFERILVVTHIEELKDQFPVRINIVKNASGSTFAFA